jgi:hypothetical protein
MAKEPDAQNFSPAHAAAKDIVEALYNRAALVVGKHNADLVRDRLASHSDEWARLADDALRYSWHDDTRRPPNNSRVLLRTAGTTSEGKWPAPGSLREVETTAAFFLDETEGQ